MDKSQILKLYDKGLSLREIADLLNVSRETVRKALKQAGITLRDTGRPNEGTLKQEIIPLPEINYIVVVKGYIPDSPETLFKFHCAVKASLLRNDIQYQGYPASLYEIKDMRFWVNPDTNKASKLKCIPITEIAYCPEIRLTLGKPYSMDLDEPYNGSSHDDVPSLEDNPYEDVEEADTTEEVLTE